MVEDVAVLIPAYQPDESLVTLVEELRARFVHVVVVDDGSTVGAEAFASVRPRVDALLAHERNRGKGAALRTGFAWIRENLPHVKGVVTADADGQHKVADICRVAAEVPSWQGGLVLGVRRFVGRVPLRSRFGNFWARVSGDRGRPIRIRDEDACGREKACAQAEADTDRDGVPAGQQVVAFSSAPRLLPHPARASSRPPRPVKRPHMAPKGAVY